MTKILVALLLLFPQILCAVETRTYLVYRRDNFPQDRYLSSYSPLEYQRFIDLGKKTIADAGGQPYRITSYEINFDGKYALWTITYQTEDEKWHIDSMEKQGYIMLLSSCEVVQQWNPQINYVETVLNTSTLSQLPTDYYQVVESTGT